MAKVSQFLRLEDGEEVYLITSRTLFSKLWLINNRALELAILGYLAKYQRKYSVKIYAFILMGNHYHLIASFPKRNRALFMQAFNSVFCTLVKRHVPRFPGGPLWGRRYSAEALPNNEDISHWSLYAWLNPVAAGLCRNARKHLQYNSFEDAARGLERVYQVFNASQYQNRKRYNRNLKKSDCTDEFVLSYSKLPEFQDLEPEEYRQALGSLLEERTGKLCEERDNEGKGFADPRKLKRETPGLLPKRTKTSTRESRRPLVLTLCAETRRLWLAKYFSVLEAYLKASERYRRGNGSYVFPPGTYLPRKLVA